jgi:hypothetical protein
MEKPHPDLRLPNHIDMEVLLPQFCDEECVTYVSAILGVSHPGIRIRVRSTTPCRMHIVSRPAFIEDHESIYLLANRAIIEHQRQKRRIGHGARDG